MRISKVFKKSLLISLVTIFFSMCQSLLVLAAGSEKFPATPPAGSPERILILDALRGQIKGSHSLEVVFVVKHLKTKDGWAWVHARPQDSKGAGRYEDVSALLRKRGTIWEVAELACSEIDNDQCLTNPNYFKFLKQRFPGLPIDILPYGGT